jgi:hypothetical protein
LDVLLKALLEYTIILAGVDVDGELTSQLQNTFVPIAVLYANVRAQAGISEVESIRECDSIRKKLSRRVSISREY